MNVKTNLLVKDVNFVDTTKKKQNKNLWKCSIILVFLLNNLTSIRVAIHS